jgi:hypothetical protein
MKKMNPFVKMLIKTALSLLISHEAEIESHIADENLKVAVRAACAACAQLKPLLDA